MDYRADFAAAMGLVLATAMAAPERLRVAGVQDLAASWLRMLPGDDAGAVGARALLGGVDAASHESLLAAAPGAATLLMRRHVLDARFGALVEAVKAGPGVVAVARVRAAYAALSPADRALLVATEPWLVGNLDGIPFGDRIAANRVAVRAALATTQNALEADGFSTVNARMQAEADAALYSSWLDDSLDDHDATGQSVKRTGHRIVLFDAAGGRFAEVVGHLGADTEHVGVLVGGTGTKLASMNGQYERAWSLVAQGGGQLAVVTYLGGQMPQTIPEAALPYFANAHAAGLRDFAFGLDRPAGASLTVAGHSYGGSLVGAAEREGMIVDRVLHIESAGAGPAVGAAADYADPDTSRYSMTAPDDFINLAQGTGVPSPVHGTDPDEVDGVVRLETGWLNDEDHQAGLISGFIASHSDVFLGGSTAWKNIYSVMTGGEVALDSDLRAEVIGEGQAARYVVVDPVTDPAFTPPTAPVR